VRVSYGAGLRTKIATLMHESAETLRMNDIGVSTLQLMRPIAVDLYADNRTSGSFVLIRHAPVEIETEEAKLAADMLGSFVIRGHLLR
jgi:sulfate adenylyltransferase subunit 1 (EFTu-like GTPase family)